MEASERHPKTGKPVQPRDKDGREEPVYLELAHTRHCQRSRPPSGAFRGPNSSGSPPSRESQIDPEFNRRHFRETRLPDRRAPPRRELRFPPTTYPAIVNLGMEIADPLIYRCSCRISVYPGLFTYSIAATQPCVRGTIVLLRGVCYASRRAGVIRSVGAKHLTAFSLSTRKQPLESIKFPYKILCAWGRGELCFLPPVPGYTYLRRAISLSIPLHALCHPSRGRIHYRKTVVG